jgi:hypothetical protein
MPALVNSRVGSSGHELEATIWWPLEAKNSRNFWRISALFIGVGLRGVAGDCRERRFQSLKL